MNSPISGVGRGTTCTSHAELFHAFCHQSSLRLTYPRILGFFMMILGIFDNNDVAAMMVCKRPCLAVMRLCTAQCAAIPLMEGRDQLGHAWQALVHTARDGHSTVVHPWTENKSMSLSLMHSLSHCMCQRMTICTFTSSCSWRGISQNPIVQICMSTTVRMHAHVFARIHLICCHRT